MVPQPTFLIAHMHAISLPHLMPPPLFIPILKRAAKPLHIGMYSLAIVSIHVETGFNSCFPPETVPNSLISATKTDNGPQLYKMFLKYS
jgi:hypothetical protein